MYATVAEVKTRATFPEVRALPDDDLTAYIDRANAYLHRSTRRNFADETDPDIVTDLRTATIMLVEYLWFWDHPEIKESGMAGVDSERIGSYSYTAKKVPPGENTGIPELDMILGYLRAAPAISVPFFAVRGDNREV